MPETLDSFKAEFPRAWAAYEELKTACDTQGPLDGKTVELIKVGISAALEHDGGLVALISQAKKAGAKDSEIFQAILLATSLAGFPAALAGYRAAKDYLAK